MSQTEARLSLFKQKRVLTLSILTVLVSLALFAPFLQGVMGADGSEGSISVDVTEVVAGTNIYVELDSLDESSDYSLVVSSDDTYTNFTTGSDQTSMIVGLNIPAPDSGHTVTVSLYPQSNHTTAIDSVTLFVRDTDFYIPMDMLIELGIAIFIVLVIAYLVVNLIRSSRSNA